MRVRCLLYRLRTDAFSPTFNCIWCVSIAINARFIVKMFHICDMSGAKGEVGGWIYIIDSAEIIRRPVTRKHPPLPPPIHNFRSVESKLC